ncbi:MAG TPA: TonB-dependent receptor [Caulobacteraceae bacterium]|nr:TonB-dependent receptor [Caulobacteraceae bacterium]
MLAILAAAVTAASPAALPGTLQGVEVVGRAPVVGTLQQGVQAYRSEFFTQVRPGTAFDMVQWLPGFTFEDARDVRGLAGAAGNVLIDGQPPTAKNDTLAMVLRRIPAAQVDRVDIIVGGAPGVDMRGRAVIANVVLKKTGAPRGSLTAQTYVFEDGRVRPEVQATLSRKSGEHAMEASFTLARRPLNGVGPGIGVLERRDPAGALLFSASSRILGWQDFGAGSAAYEFPWAGGKLRVNGSATYIAGMGNERADVDGSPALYTIDVEERFRQAELGLRYQRSFGRVALETQALQRMNVHSQVQDTFRPPVDTGLTEKDTLSETVARGTLCFNRDATLSLEASAEGAFNSLDTDSAFTSDGRPVRVPAEDVAVSERRGEFGVLATWKPSKTFSLTPGLKVETSGLQARGDVNLERDLTYLKPRAVLSWSPDARTQIRLRGEHEVSQISFQNFTASVDTGAGLVRAGNPDLRPRRAWVAEAVVERQFWTGGSLVLTLRQSALRDVVDQLALPQFGGAVAIGNIGDGDQTDLIVALTLPLKRLGLQGMNLKGTATLRRSEVTDPTTGDRRRVSGQSALAAELHFSHDLPRWKINWGIDVFYNGPSAAYRPANVERVGGWARVSAFVEHRLRPDLVLRVEGFNLVDAKPRLVEEAYGGLRSAAPLLYSETRRNGDAPNLFVRIRKTLS